MRTLLAALALPFALGACSEEPRPDKPPTSSTIRLHLVGSVGASDDWFAPTRDGSGCTNLGDLEVVVKDSAGNVVGRAAFGSGTVTSLAYADPKQAAPCEPPAIEVEGLPWSDHYAVDVSGPAGSTSLRVENADGVAEATLVVD